MVENKLVIPDEMMQYLNQSILGTEPPAATDPDKTDSKINDPTTKDKETSDINNSSDKISDVATSDDSLLKNLGAIGSDLNISDIPVDLRSLDVSMSGNSGSLLAAKSPDDKNTPLQEQVIPEAPIEKPEQEQYTKPPTNTVNQTNPLQSLQSMTANQGDPANRMRTGHNNPLPQKQNPAVSPKTMVMSPQSIPQNVMSPQSLAHSMMSPRSLPHSAMSPQSVMSPHMNHNVMSPPSVYNVMSPQSAMSVMSPQHSAMSPQSMQSLMSPQHQMQNQMMVSPRHNNMGSPMSQNMTSPMVNIASPMAQNMTSPMSHGMQSPMHPGLQNPMANPMANPIGQNMPMNGPNPNMMMNMNNINQQVQQPPPNYNNNLRQNCNQKIPNKPFNNVAAQYQNQNFNQPAYPQNQPNVNMRSQNNMQQYQMMQQQYNQNQMANMQQNQNLNFNNQMHYPPVNYQNQNNQMHPMQMSRSSVMSVDNSASIGRGTLNSYCDQQQYPQMQHQYVQNHYPQPPPYNSVVNTNVMGPPPPKNNHQYNQTMMNNNQYYNHQRPYNQWDYPGNQFNKHNGTTQAQKSVQNSVNMSTGSQKPNPTNPRASMVNNNMVKNLEQTDCSMNSLKSQSNKPSDVQVWDISQSQIEASNGRKKNQNHTAMRQETYQRTLEYVENCENWKSSEMVSSSTHPLQGGDNMVVNDLQTSLSSFYEENQYLQMIQ